MLYHLKQTPFYSITRRMVFVRRDMDGSKIVFSARKEEGSKPSCESLLSSLSGLAVPSLNSQ